MPFWHLRLAPSMPAGGFSCLEPVQAGPVLQAPFGGMLLPYLGKVQAHDGLDNARHKSAAPKPAKCVKTVKSGPPSPQGARENESGCRASSPARRRPFFYAFQHAKQRAQKRPTRVSVHFVSFRTFGNRICSPDHSMISGG
jgi:hypothetical protein